jgi:hypothetical protein
MNKSPRRPPATNLSIVTADRMILVSQRSLCVVWNPGSYCPAQSGTGSPLLDCDADGRKNPFCTAQREAFEEATGPLLPDFVDHLLRPGSHLQGAVPVRVRRLRLPITASQPLSQMQSEGLENCSLIGMPFTIDG